ncbi:hypothetical protein CPCC7001_170 [Cyanobium sp. PCC 7001]|nr:hypothetical protein CPCC7001_170 [Cyanobium sp. PCC 7001]
MAASANPSRYTDQSPPQAVPEFRSVLIRKDLPDNLPEGDLIDQEPIRKTCR